MSLLIEKEREELRRMRRPKLPGVYVPLHTPFNRDGSIDFERLSKHLELVANAGVHGVVYPSHISEDYAMTSEEVYKCVDKLLDMCSGNLKIVSMARALSATIVREFASRVTDLGINYIMLDVSCIRADAESLAAYVSALANSIDSAIIVLFGERQLPPTHIALVIESAPNIVAVATRSSSMEWPRELARAVAGVVSVWEASPVFAPYSLRVGFDGLFTSSATVFPAPTMKMYSLVLNGLVEDAYRIHSALSPYILFESSYGVEPPVVKAALEKLYGTGGHCRPPYSIPDDVELEALELLLESTTASLKSLGFNVEGVNGSAGGEP